MDFLTISQILGNFGEFVGAIAVVITLGYLAVQVRHSKEATEANTRSIRSAARFEAGKCWWEEALQLALSSDMARIVAVGNQDPARLKEEELHRLNAWGLQYFLRDDMLYHQYQEGALPEDVWRAHELVTIAQIREDRVWQAVQSGHFPISREFKVYLSRLREENRSTSWSWPPKLDAEK